VADIRHFLIQAGLSRGRSSEPAKHAGPAQPSLLIAVDHHGAKIFQVDVTSDDAAAHVVRPYDPHHFLHHLTHKDQSRERGQRAPEEPAYYEKIAAAVAAAGKIVVVGHGSGKSNAEHHLVEYLKAHHRETYDRIVREIVADLSSVTTAQLLDIAQTALRG
jgi:stalled ribosome rescue protein Dom34